MDEQSRQFTLLLVDDNPTNLTLLTKIIELDLPQVRVLTASNGKDGLKLAEQFQVDGAFIDVQMPQMSGLEMCRRLKSEPRTAGMPLVLITAHLASPEMRAEGLEVGAHDFISQPISNVEMLARIKVMLRLCQGERERQGDPLQKKEQPEEYSAQLRWLSGLLLSGNGQSAETDQALLQVLAGKLSAAEQLQERQLTELLADSFPLPWRRTLLKLALLDKLPLSLAGKLSEISDIEAVFDYLQRHDLLLLPAAVGTETLQFKADVRDLLRGRVAQLLNLEEQQQVCLFAADWYQQKRVPLAAFQCFLQAEQYPAISQLLSHAGLELLENQYQPQLLGLLAQVPEVEAVRCGWLALYTGVGYLRKQPLEADTWLELARNRFIASSDQRGELLTLSQQILQYIIADGQVELGMVRLLRLRDLAEAQLELLTPFNRLKVLFSQALGELYFAGELATCEEYLARAMAEALREKKDELQMELSLLAALLGLFQGRYRVARSGMEQAIVAVNKLPQRRFPAQLFSLVACEVLYGCGELESFSQQRHMAQNCWGAAEFKESALAPQLSFDSALGDLARGRFTAAEELLKVTLHENPAAARPHLQSWLLQLRGLLHAQAGRIEAAKTDCAKGLELRTRVAIDLHQLPNLILAGATSLLLQDYQVAVDQLQTGLAKSIALGEERYRGGFHAWLAALHIDRKEDALALAQLEKLLELLRRQRVDSFFALTPDLIRKLVPLLATIPEWNEPMRRLAQRWLDCGVTDNGSLLPLAHLQTLGGFKFRLNGQCCDLSEVGQSSRQLMALLAVAPNCSMSSELLMGTLWPESPPSKARNSFDTALSRLRKGLENVFGKDIRKDYLLLEKGMLLLRHIQVDGVGFSSAVEKARRHLQRQNSWQAELAFWQADRLWHGEFLVGFELDADLPYCRDQFNQLRLEQLIGLASQLRQRGESSEAVRLLQVGLYVDPTHDLLVQQLLDIYQQQNEKRAARQLLENYRKALQDEEYDDEEIDELIATLGPQRLEI